jgi:hypothetical protein
MMYLQENVQIFSIKILASRPRGIQRENDLEIPYGPDGVTS